MTIELLTTAAGIAMSAGYYPQAYKLWRSCQAQGLSLLSALIFAGGTTIWTVYGLTLRDPAIVLSFGFGMVGSWLNVLLILRAQYYAKGNPRS